MYGVNMPLSLLASPREIKDQIYTNVLQQQRELPIKVKGSKIRLTIWKLLPPKLKRVRAFLRTRTDHNAHDCFLFTSCELAQVNKQIRYEFFDFLRTAEVDLIVTVQNFDFLHIFDLINSLPQKAN